MTNRPKQKGTAAETAVVQYLQNCGFENAERRALSGKHDKGDIANMPVVIEVKNQKELKLAQWIKEALAEAENASLDVGVVWHKRVGKASPRDWYVTMNGNAFVELLMAYAEERNRTT